MFNHRAEATHHPTCSGTLLLCVDLVLLQCEQLQAHAGLHDVFHSYNWQPPFQTQDHEATAGPPTPGNLTTFLQSWPGQKVSLGQSVTVSRAKTLLLSAYQEHRSREKERSEGNGETASSAFTQWMDGTSGRFRVGNIAVSVLILILSYSY